MLNWLRLSGSLTNMFANYVEVGIMEIVMGGQKMRMTKKQTRLLAVLVSALGGLAILVAVTWVMLNGTSGGDSIGQTLRDVRYCQTSNSSQEYDLYLPSTPRIDGVPIVIHVHGGGWSSGDKQGGIADHYADAFAQRGIAFASVDYRLATEAVYPAQNEDVQCAVEHLQANAERYGINGENVIMMGDSAGGHLAALEGLDAVNDHVKGVIMLYGVSDLWAQITKYKDTNAIHYLGKRDETLAKQASPLYQRLAGAPPFLLIHGTNDSIVPASESQYFAEQLRKNNSQALYIPIEGAGHAFADGVSDHEERAREHVIEFVETVFDLN